MTTPSVQNMPEQRYEVTPLELFFDLVFVFAVSQLSQHLLTPGIINSLIIEQA